MKLNNLMLATISGCLYLLIGAFLCVYSTTLFFSGFHNLDTAQNMRYIEQETGRELFDFASDMNVYDEYELYAIGFNYMKTGFGLAFLAGLFIGISFVLMLYIHDFKVEGNEMILDTLIKKGVFSKFR